MDIMDYKLPGDKKSKKKTKKPTLRFELDLPESTDNCCPEYSYIDLVRETLKERKSKGQNDTLCQNLLEEEEEKERDEARAIAEYYEIKYGATAATGQKRKRKDKGRDLVGAGYGYDENDPFVDDSEAYDEIVPASLTTQHGGFYINVGKLNFRTLSDDSDTNSTSSDDSVPLSHHAAKKKKAFRLLGSDESENEFKAVVDGVIKKKKRLKEAKVPGAKKRKMSLNGKDKVPGLKQRSKKMKKPTSLAQKLIAKAKAQQMMNASGVGSPGHPSNGAIPQYRKLSEDKAASKSTSGELGHLESKDLAQVAKQMTKELMSVGSSKVSPESDRKMENGFNTITPTTSASKNTPNVNHELPPNLPQMLGDRIDSLKKIAKSTEDTGKMKFFSSDVNRILLSIEESAQGLRNKERQGMYQHIAQHLPCSKDTLLKRVKKLQEEDSDQQLEGPIQRLKTAVDAVMTTQIEAYVLECDSKSEKFPSAAAAASTDEDEENEDRSMDGAGEKAKRTYAPRRKFKWDDNLRKLLWEVVAVKMNLYERFKVREKQTAEEYLKVFLESTIKPLWPKPWMQTRILFKESRSAHERLTLNCQKHKKAGSNKKVLGVNKEPSKPPDSSSNQRAISTVQNYGGQIETAAKIPKKQLIFDSAESKNSHFAAGTGGASKGASGVIDLTTAGGIELVASIEGDNFNKPKKGAMSQSKGAARTTPKELQGTWKPVTSNIKNTKIPAKTSSSLALSSVGTKKTDKKVEHKAKSNAGASNRVPDTFPMDSKMIQEYASDFVKLMMTPGQLPQAPGAYLGMQGLSNYDTISKILGLKPDDVMPQPKPTTTAQNDEKFQFKISSNPTISASKLDHFSPKGGFPPMDPTRKRVVQVLDSTSWMAQKSGSMKLPDKESGISTNHESYSSAPNLSPRSVPSPHSTSFNSKHVLAQSTSGFPPSFLIPPADSSKFITQRLKKSGHSQSPNQSNLDSATKIQKLSTAGSGTTSPKQNASPLTLPLSRQPYHHSGSPSAQSDPLLAGLPSMGLSPRTGQFSPARVGSSFSPAFTTPGGSPYSSTFKAPQSPVHKYPSVPMSIAGHPFGSSFTGYPQVQLVDIERNKDSVKHINVQGNQSR